MELENINIDIVNGTDFIQNNNINFNMNPFYKMIQIIKDTFKSVGIDYNDMKIFYQRFANGKSLLAIKVLEGDDNDQTNYMFNFCQATHYGKDTFCNVYLHADKKCSKIASKLIRLLSKNIISFFEEIERDFNKKGITNLECSFLIPLINKKLDANSSKNNTSKIKKLINNILGKK